MHEHEVVVGNGEIASAARERAPVMFVCTRQTTLGTYPYICAFHDQLGMVGEVVVLP